MINSNKSLLTLTSTVLLKDFSLFAEYFVSISAIYVLIVLVLITYSVFGLLLQKTLSECIALILLMAFYLILNDDFLLYYTFGGYNTPYFIFATYGSITFQKSIILDYLAFIAKFLICIFSSFYFILISSSLKEYKLTSFEYLLIILFSILGMLLMCSSNDLLTAYLSIELSGLAFYILASFKKTSIYSVESGLKYFIIGCVSSAFFLLGSSFIYLSAGSMNFDDLTLLFKTDIYFVSETPIFNEYDVEQLLINCNYMNFNIISSSFNNNIDYIDLKNISNIALDDFDYIMRYTLLSDLVFDKIYETLWDIRANSFAEAVKNATLRIDILDFDYNVIELGFAFIVFSLCIKLAAAPFHLWSLDVYEGSPISSSFFFAAITKLSVFVLLIRVYFICFFSIFSFWHFYFFWIGLLSVFVGSIGGLKQRRLKTLLAYSSVTNMGYGLLALGTGTPLGIQMLFVHLIIYTISGLCTWSILIFLRLKTKKLIDKHSKDLSDLSLLQKSNSALAFSFSLTMFSLAGIPPMVGFLAKMGIFLSLIHSTFYIFAIISAVCSVLATFYYIRIIKIIFFENLLVGKLYYPINSLNIVFLSILVFLLLVWFLNPTMLYLWSYQIIPSHMTMIERLLDNIVSNFIFINK
jgi:NADH:ubiquinone oxidoreductase subunit 2 (subunit N)